MKILGKIKHAFIFIKVIAQRVGSYIALVNIAMIMFLTMSDLKTKGYVKFDIGFWIIPIYIGFIAFIFVLGYLEMYIFKGFYKEQEIQYTLTPVHPDVDDMHKKINEMYDEFKKNQKV